MPYSCTSRDKKFEGEEIAMKFYNIVRTSLIVAGFSAALVLLPASVKAQEITNTEFNDGPNVTTLAQPSVEQTTINTMPSSQALQASESITASVQPEQASFIQVPAPSDKWVSTSLLVGIGAIALYALAEAKRANRVLNSYRGY
jgi:hypothetical protein